MVFGIVVSLIGRLEAQVRHEFRELHMGLEVRIVLYAPNGDQARAAARAAFVRVADMEQIMSDYRPKSEVRLLDGRAGAWVPVSDDLFRVLASAVEVAAASNGAFDPTAAPLVALWREARRVHRLPSPAQIDSARMFVNWRRISLDSATRRVRLRAGTRIDLGGIAKGDIVQQAIATLRANGIASALVEAGGDIAVSDAPPGQPGWRVAVASGDTAMVRRAAALTNAVISTSGPAFQFLEIDGKRYSHVVDPRTGMGLTSNTQATVISSNGALADALSTALTILRADQATRVLARYPGALASVSR